MKNILQFAFVMLATLLFNPVVGQVPLPPTIVGPGNVALSQLNLCLPVGTTGTVALHLYSPPGGMDLSNVVVAEWQEGDVDGNGNFVVTATHPTSPTATNVQTQTFTYSYVTRQSKSIRAKIFLLSGTTFSYTNYFYLPVGLQGTVGTLGGGGAYLNSGSGLLQLTNFNGLARWKKRLAGATDWTDIPANDNNLTFNYTGVTSSTEYSINVSGDGGCYGASSNIVKVDVYKTGTVTGPSSVTEGERITVGIGTSNRVIQWEYSHDGGTTWTIVAITVTAYRHQITANTRFRALVDLGPFGNGYSGTWDIAAIPYNQVYADPANGGNYVRQQQVTVRGITNPNDVNLLSPSQKHEVITYLDGMGRPVQQNIRKGSPLQKDIISVSAYDGLGRQSTQYLPYISGGNDGTYHTNAFGEQLAYYVTGADKVAQSYHPYATTIFEASPLGRAIEQGSVGTAFQPNSMGHTYKANYLNNADGEVRLFKTDGASTTFYPAYELAKTEGIDADQKKTQTFTDKAGQTILTRVQLDDNINGTFVPWLETYYIYNEAGAVNYIISPKGTSALQANGWNLSPSILNQYVHQFVYDSRGRLAEKKVPGQAVTYYCYDILDRLVLMQDGHTRSANQWIYIKYDRKGRPVMQGLYTNTTYTTKATLQVSLIDPLYAADTDPYYETRGAAAHGYTNQTFPTTNTQVHTVNYYDDYDFDNNGTSDYAYTPQGLDNENTPAAKALGRPTGSKRLVLDGGNTWLYNIIFYDVDGRTIQARSNNHLNPAAIDNLTTVVYDFEGKLMLQKTYHNAGAGKVTTVVNKYQYDHMGRVINIFQNNNNAGADQLVAYYQYNEIGQLVTKNLHNTATSGGTPPSGGAGGGFMQAVDLRYSIQGWLTSINNAQLTSNDGNASEPLDYFGMELLYEKTETGLTASGDVLYNGNVSAVKWKGAGAATGTADQKSYKFTYDKSNKLTSATSQLYNGSAWTKEAGAMNEAMSYDHNGNILTLQRNQRRYQPGVVPSYSIENIDNLSYSYDPAMGDQLLKVTDAASGTAPAGFNNGTSGVANDYLYDGNGNLIKDLNKGISNIVYNHLGKPTTITFTDGRHVDYVYDATGDKLTMKAYKTGNVLQTTTDYANGFVYENNTLSFFGSPEGRVVNKNGTLEYQYAIADHQGNTRVVFTSAAPTPQVAKATYETTAQAGEAGSFDSYPATSGINPVSTNNHTTGGTKSQYLNGGYNGMVGVTKSYKVYPGDQVKIEAYARYNAPTSNSSGLNGFAAALLAAFNVTAPAVGEAGTAASALNNFGSLAASGFGDGTSDNTDPKAFVNIILFDKNYNFLDVAYAQVNSDGAPAYISANYTVKEEGYVFMYISNEQPTQTDVYFDDVTMTYTPTNIIQYNEFYPFGLQASTSWTRDNTIGNNFLANGSTELNTTTGLYDLDYRSYDASIGRLFQVDPLATTYASFSAYHYSFNNPVMFNDPSGADPDPNNKNDPWAGYNAGPMSVGTWDANGTFHWNDAAVNGPADGLMAQTYGQLQDMTNIATKMALLSDARNGDMDAARAYASANGDLRSVTGYYFTAREDANGNEIAGSRTITGFEYGKKGADSGLGPSTLWERFSGIRQVNGWMVDDHGKFTGYMAPIEFTIVVGPGAGISSYAVLKQITSGWKGLIQAHHIVEVRHLKALGMSIYEAPAIILSRAKHAEITKSLQTLLPTGYTYTRTQIMAAYEQAYAAYPAWIKAASNYLGL